MCVYGDNFVVDGEAKIAVKYLEVAGAARCSCWFSESPDRLDQMDQSRYDVLSLRR